MWNRFAPRLRRLVTAATEIAGGAGCEEVACEHILLAIARDQQSAGHFVLRQAGIDFAALAPRLEQMRPCGERTRQRAVRLSASAMHLLDVAGGEADRLGHSNVGTEHVALATTKMHACAASELLREMGLTADAAEAAVREWTTRDKSQAVTAARGQSTSSKWLPASLGKMFRLPGLAWKVYGRKSLGHPKFVSDPYPLYRWLREREPVRKDPIAPVWVVTGHADVTTMLKDPRFRKDVFASERLPAAVREQLGVPAGESARSDVETVSMLFLDPPQHTRVRSLFSRAFTPRVIENLRPRIQQITDKRLEKVISTGWMDVIKTLAYPLPVVVIAELLGFPPEDYPRFKKWSDDFAAALALNATSDQHAQAAKSRAELEIYFAQVVENLRHRPGDDLISAFLAMENEPGSLSREELFINSALLLAAGHETTTNLIGNGMLALLRNPSQLRLLVEKPTLIDSAVEELLRFDSPVQWVSRIVAEPLTLGEVKLEPGAILLGSVGGANRDPAVFDRPEELDIQRADNRHISFGTGVHFCLGASLARMEARIAIGTMVNRLKNLRLAKQKIVWRKGLTFRAVEKLIVEFDAEE